jgi:hypothetical protein
VIATDQQLRKARDSIHEDPQRRQE